MDPFRRWTIRILIAWALMFPTLLIAQLLGCIPR